MIIGNIGAPEGNSETEQPGRATKRVDGWTSSAPLATLETLSGLMTEISLPPVLEFSRARNLQRNWDGEFVPPGNKTKGEISSIPPPEILTAAPHAKP